MIDPEIDLCGLCGRDHEGQCPGTEPPAPFVDTRPRYPYRLPDSRVVQVIHDHCETPRTTITYDNGRGGIAEGVLVVAEHATRPARDDVRRTGALIALLSAWFDAAAIGALPHASLQIFGDDAAEALETWASARGATVEHDTLSAILTYGSAARTTWGVVRLELGGAAITAHRDHTRN